MTRLASRLAPIAMVFSVFGAASALAQDTPGSQSPASDVPRYSFFKVQDTFIRLDSVTGQVATCGHGGSGWACKLAPDERSALESEIARVQGDNAALKKELLGRGIELPGNMKADAVPMVKADPKAEPRPVPPRDVPQEPSVKLPSDAELDKVMGFMEKVWGRLVEMMAQFQRDMRKNENKSDKS